MWWRNIRLFYTAFILRYKKGQFEPNLAPYHTPHPSPLFVDTPLFRDNGRFYFSKIAKAKVKKEILHLSSKKSMHNQLKSLKIELNLISTIWQN